MARSSHLKPGEKGEIDVSVDIHGRKGFISKTVQVYVNDPLKPLTTLTLKMFIKDRVHTYRNRSDGIFSEKCRDCHVEQGRGKRGWELFKADCFMCHNAGRNTTISAMSKKTRRQLLRDIRDGVENTEMPGFGIKNGGPLDDAEIESLIELILQ